MIRYKVSISFKKKFLFLERKRNQSNKNKKIALINNIKTRNKTLIKAKAENWVQIIVFIKKSFN